jgi:G6PDH family F420-dependent oxidoreductase
MSDPSSDGVRLGWWLSSEEHDPRALVTHAAAAEAAGFPTAMISDHLRPWTTRQGQAPHVWTVLGALAQATSGLEIGTGVTAMIHRSSPINVAHAAATAAVMFEGRFFLGVGTGERLNEQAFADTWPSSGARRDRLGEAIGIVKLLLRGETVDHAGPCWTVEGLQLATRPATPPPILVAASGKRSAQLAGEAGDGLIAVTPDANLVDVFRASGGADKRCVAQLHVSIATTIEQASENAWAWWPNAVVPPKVLTELAQPDDFSAVAGAIGPDNLADTVVCATDAEPVIAAIDRYAGAGYDTVYLHQIGPDQPRLRDLAVNELLPHYHRATQPR